MKNKTIIEKIISNENVEEILQEQIENIFRNGTENAETLEILTYIKIYQPSIFEKYEDSILLKMGLFFKDSKPTEFTDLIFSIYKESIIEEYNQTFTPIQIDIVNKILKNKMFSFSSPTSTGKSFVFRHIIKTFNNDIVIIVPSRALINEYQILVKNLVDEKTVNVLTFVDLINKKKIKRNIFIITPERTRDLFVLRDQLNVDVIMFDEAQLSNDYSVRGLYYDSVIRRCVEYFQTTKFIFAYPFVDNPEVQYKKNNIDYTESNFKTFKNRNVGQIFYSVENNIFYHFGLRTEIFGNRVKVETDPLEETIQTNGSALIYCTKQSIYKKEIFTRFLKYINKCESIQDEAALNLIEQFRTFIGANNILEGDYASHMVYMMKKGVVIHHGSIPLQARYLIEEFVKKGYCRLCFATSTLEQGINMPFDLVWIDRFDKSKPLNVKNLIGRAGRSTKDNKFDYGKIVIADSKKGDLRKVLLSDIKLKEVSQLDEQTDENDDYKEYKDAIKNNQFSEEYNLTFKELKRVQSEECKLAINTILDTLFNNGELIVTEDFQLKLMTYDAFKKIYSSYLNRELTIAESSIVDSAVKILLWKILGKDFNQIVWFRYSHGAKTKERGKIKKQIKESNNPEEIRRLEYYNKTIDANYLPMFQTIPDKSKKPLSITYRTKACHVDYDRVVVDTYDYLDKLIGFRWGDCYYAAFDKFYQETNDIRAQKMTNYIKYGTNDEMEIMLLRYGFIFEDFSWLKPIILNINEDEIKFKEDLQLTTEQLNKISKYL